MWLLNRGDYLIQVTFKTAFTISSYHPGNLTPIYRVNNADFGDFMTRIDHPEVVIVTKIDPRQHGNT